MNILFIAEELDRPERAYIQMLARKGLNLELMLSPSAETQDLKDAGIAVQSIPLASRTDKPTVNAIRSRLERGGIDIVHCLRNNRPLSTALLATKTLSIPVVAYRGTVGHLSRLDPGSRMTYLNKRVSCITCVSDAVRRYLRTKGVPDAKLATVYKGHDTAWYRSTPPVDLADLGVPRDAVTVCCAANMRPVKGIDVLLKALKLLPASSPLHLVLVGKVQDKRIEPLAADPGIRDRVHFAGFQANAPGYIAACSIFVMPSVKREGLPRAAIEAMSMGIPPVVSDAGGMPELVEHDQSGLVVPASDPASLARALQRLAEDEKLRTRLGEAAQKRIESHFSVGQTTAQLMDIYTRLAG